jgi:23S rRNA (cytidine1920-2'-O)/16S rRNA (cytidine1409-2'-O)-methyltransferase
MPPKAKARSPKKRLDILMVERGLAESRQRAQALLLAGHVIVAGQRVEKAGAQVPTDARIEIIGDALPFVSRGGVKLAGALDDFGLAIAGKTCLDVGSSTGGFTDCLLQRGAKRVYALDVSPDQLAWKLRQDPRVVLIERNARYLRADDIPEPVDLVAVDVSFISVTKIISVIATVAKPGVDILILIKPQFELERGDVGKGGIVRDSN